MIHATAWMILENIYAKGKLGNKGHIVFDSISMIYSGLDKFIDKDTDGHLPGTRREKMGVTAY